MGLSDRRRALMAGGGNYTWNPAFGIHVRMTEYYQSGAILEQIFYYIFVNFPVEDLTGTNSKYVIVVYDDDFGGKILSIIPRENRKDSDISDKRVDMNVQDSNGDIMKVDQIFAYVGGTFNLVSVFYGSVTDVNESNSYRTSYYLTGKSGM